MSVKMKSKSKNRSEIKANSQKKNVVKSKKKKIATQKSSPNKSLASTDSEEMDIDKFLEHGLDDLSDSSESSEAPNPPKKKSSKLKTDVKVKNGNLTSEKQKKRKSDISKTQDIPKEKSPKKGESEAKKHKRVLDNLSKSDPEFYEFLKSEDSELLDFEIDEDDEDGEDAGDTEGDSSAEEDEEEAEKEIEEKTKKKKQKSKDLKGSDSESEADDLELEAKPVAKQSAGTKVTIKMVKQWSAELQNKNLSGLRETALALQAAVSQTGKGDNTAHKYVVHGTAVFNAVISHCLREVLPMLSTFMNLPKSSNPKKPVLPSTKEKKWRRVHGIMQIYLNAFCQLLSSIADASAQKLLLNHCLHLSSYIACYPKITRNLIKRLTKIWSSDSEQCRVMAFLCINRLVLILQDQQLEQCIKALYLEYVKNCKFTSPTSLSSIQFMQRSLVELFAINPFVTYQHAFTYIRQLAIHLRNAILIKKKENTQAVYNWQYIHSLELWAEMLATLSPSSDVIKPLIYPLTQVVIGTLELAETPQYLPLRFHCVRVLHTISKSTGTYIPTLPFLLKVFTMIDFNQRSRKMSIKPFNFACILKLSKSHLEESAFRDGVVEQLNEHLMEFLSIHSHTIAFPELVLPLCQQLRQFLKLCKVAKFTRPMKRILDKVKETSEVMTSRRKSAAINVPDISAVTAWEAESAKQGTPLSAYYVIYRKLRAKELAMAQGKYEEEAVKKNKKKMKEDTDDSDEEGDEPKAKKQKKDSSLRIDKKVIAELEAEEDAEDEEDDVEEDEDGEDEEVEEELSEDDGDDVEDVVEDLELSDLD